MPILKTAKINDKSVYAIWEITEDAEQLSRLVKSASNVQLPDTDITNDIKRAEWMAGRLLLSSLVNELGKPYSGIYKDEHGKPHLKGFDLHISLSHSYPLVAAIIHHSPVGIDIEQPKEKLKRIATRFLTEVEQEICGDDLEILCAFWCAKEALYKLYGKKKLIFKENLAIDYKIDNGSKRLSGKVIVNGNTEEYQLRVEKVKNSLLVFTL
jgi:phosphopantetheinyl transferase